MAEVVTSAHETMNQLIMGFRATHLLGVVARFGLADRLASGPRSSSELAALAGAHPEALHRVLRALAQLGVVAMLDDQSFVLTPLGTCLRTDVPGSLHAVALLRSGEYMQRPYLALEHTVRTGETAFDHAFGMNSFEYLTAHPDTAATFNNVMTAVLTRVTTSVVTSYDFRPFRTIIDVGGGNGSMTAAILQAYPELRGVVFDLPHSRESALQTLAVHGLTDRCEFVGGSFFEAVPTGVDAYLLRYILHDWDDARSVAILRTCRRAMAPDSLLLIIESLIPDHDQPNQDVVLSDVHMMILTGGRERTEDEYRALLEAADLRLVRAVPTPSGFSLLEAVPA